ncbi:hypothetical protein [Vibrio sp. VPAP30]|uniref:hypothetical protein n=1 Tax=Vibrio sp. VPAP30 TaxID=1647102 RepID=UPI0006590E23|nr:hypothetical protein [Vibrio sp. VPAP30]KLN66540.1 hypothetical protein ZX61_02485 [Vibrio sp. VPAP30]
MTQAYNEHDYLYIAYSQPLGSQFIPIVNGDITFFIPASNWTSYVHFGSSITKGGSNDHESDADLRIVLQNGKPSFKFISSIEPRYLNEINYKHAVFNGKLVTEIAIPKRLFGKHIPYQDVTIINQYKGSLFGSKEGSSAGISRMSRSLDFTNFDFSDHTITVGMSFSGLGVSGSAGLAGDHEGLGGYYSGTAGSTDFALTVDAGIFRGELADLKGLTADVDVPAGMVAIKTVTPTSGSPLGSGLVFSWGAAGGYVNKPGCS